MNLGPNHRHPLSNLNLFGFGFDVKKNNWEILACRVHEINPFWKFSLPGMRDKSHLQNMFPSTCQSNVNFPQSQNGKF